jgi:hypothetical protein
MGTTSGSLWENKPQAEMQSQPRKFQHGNFEVQQYVDGEIFVKKGAITLRISSRSNELTVTASECVMYPGEVNGLMAFRVLKKEGQ